MSQDSESRSDRADDGAVPRFAAWPHLTPGDIFSENELPQPRLTDGPLPCEKRTTGGAADTENSGLRPFLTEDDVKQWRETGVDFGDPRPPAAQSELPASVIEEYRLMDPNLVVLTMPDHDGPLADREYLEPPTLRRKDYWSQSGPVRYRREYLGSPPIKRFQEFLPPDAIGELPLRPGIEARVKNLLAGESRLPICALGNDWQSGTLFAFGDARNKIEGRKLPTALHAFAFAAYGVEDALYSFYPLLPAAAIADCFQSYDVYRHLCCFARCLEEYGLRLGRSPGVWEEEVFRGLLCIWDQFGEYASKMRLAMETLANPPTEIQAEQRCRHVGTEPIDFGAPSPPERACPGLIPAEPAADNPNQPTSRAAVNDLNTEQQFLADAKEPDATAQQTRASETGVNSYESLETKLAGKDFVSKKTAAELVGVGDRQLRNLVKDGKLAQTASGKITSQSIRAYLGAPGAQKNPEETGNSR